MYHKIAQKMGIITVKTAFDQYILYLKAARRSPQTIRSYTGRLKGFIEHFGKRPLKYVSASDLDAYMLHVATRPRRRPHAARFGETLTDATVSNTVGDIKRFYRFCLKRGLVESSPAAHLVVGTYDHDRDSRMASEADILKLLEATQLQASLTGHPLDFRNYVMSVTLVDTLARVGELVSLRMSGINFDAAKDGVVRAVVTGKTGKRVVAMSEDAALLILELHERYQRIETTYDPDVIFWSICRHHYDHPHKNCSVCRFGTRPMRTSAVQSILKKLGDDAGVKVNPQAIRHGGGWVITRKLGIHAASKKLGHSNIDITSRFYTGDAKGTVDAATRTLFAIREGENP